jgi:hypothetical protein
VEGQMSQLNDQLRRKLIEVHGQHSENVGFAEQQVCYLTTYRTRALLWCACSSSASTYPSALASIHPFSRCS